ncbi:UDP-glucose dehydrogenase family protein [Diaphorobacter caeni]|uniref:UDP-glucose dehydrogenase family protein n=1 Tax=Diaphorobacter caeni TaxID=2784387 RepID=UPI00188EF161|nr:UDP-glucose/GDP-mannose dehydrogenase family protein [Diaphorobacter caeni]MBF5003273.1 UDP-glucose/GDP-mannose dehydrogenase family protein [Diaphorobacter caeni]
MKITIVGAGYVGLVSAACFAELGNQVLCVERDAGRVERLKKAEVPIFEPGLSELIAKNLTAGRLVFTTEMKAGVRHADVLFIAVGTPPKGDSSADTSQVLAVAEQIGEHLSRFLVVVDKSTVPVGTADKVRGAIQRALKKRADPAKKLPDFAVVSNPEFLKEGAAVEDFMRPDRVVIGVSDDAAGRKAETLLRQAYAPFNRNRERLIVMDVKSAELTKYAANALLATKISFMNDMANLADALGADIEQVRKGIGSDRRIGYDFIYAGLGYGGSCFPKDVAAICHTAREAGERMRVVEAVRAVNDGQKERFVDRVIAHFGGSLKGLTIAVWGLTFKPATDDVREAPSRHIVRRLIAAGAKVRAHDPQVQSLEQLMPGDNVARLKAFIEFAADPMEAAKGADALLIATEWKVYRSPDFPALRKLLKKPVIFDGRNLFEPADMKRLGFQYQGVGRRTA